MRYHATTSGDKSNKHILDDNVGSVPIVAPPHRHVGSLYACFVCRTYPYPEDEHLVTRPNAEKGWIH